MKRFKVFAAIVLMSLFFVSTAFTKDIILEITDCKDNTIEIKNPSHGGLSIKLGEGSLDIAWNKIDKVIFPCAKQINDPNNVNKYLKDNPIEILYKNGKSVKENMILFKSLNEDKAVYTYILKGESDIGFYQINAIHIKEISAK